MISITVARGNPMSDAYEPRRCMTGHTHPSRASQRICDDNLRQRVTNDRADRPAQYRPIEEDR